MVHLDLPYGNTEISVEIPSKNFVGLVEPKEKIGSLNPLVEIDQALDNPFAASKLNEIVNQNDKVVIVVDDDTRSAPSHLMVPPILKKLQGVGVKDGNITVIFGTGTHDFVSPEEATRLLGKDVVTRVKVINHDYRASDLVYMGKTSFGTKVYLNRIFANADVKVLTGDVGFHYYAGYGGGRKSVLPGVSGLETIEHNHAMFLHPLSRSGILKGNPVSEDMTEAAKLAKIDLVLNVVQNTKKELVRAYAGDLEKPFLEGVRLVDEMYKIPVSREVDIVVVSAGGSPHDISLYQAHKAINNALNVVKKGGAIILLAECTRGHGNETWYEMMKDLGDGKEIEGAGAQMKDAFMRFHAEEYNKTLTRSQSKVKKKFRMGAATTFHFIKALEKTSIHAVSSLPHDEARNVFKLRTAKTPDAALQTALNELGKDSEILVIPHGTVTLPSPT